MSTPLVEVRDLVTTFAQRGHGLSGLVGLSRRPRVRAVDGVSLQVAAGELLALVGESGCGKTTTAQSLLKLVPIDSGRLLLDGADITETPPKAMRKLRRRMQLIYQDPYEALDPRFRVRETLEEPLLIHGLGNREERARRIEDALATVGLTPPSLFLSGTPTRCPEGSGNGWRSPPPWSWSRMSWSPTSPSRCWTSRCGPGCWPCWISCVVSAGSRSS